MKNLVLLMMIVFFSTLSQAQFPKGLSQEEAIHAATEQAQTFNPPMNINHMQDPQAIYLPGENAWIVDFTEISSTALAGSDYMVRVESSSGKAPEILLGSRKSRYRLYFSSK